MTFFLSFYYLCYSASINPFLFYVPCTLQFYNFNFVNVFLLAESAMPFVGSSWSHTCLLLCKMYCSQFCHIHRLMKNSGTLTRMNTYEWNLVWMCPVHY